MSRKDYVEAARIIRETSMPAELRAELVGRFITMFSAWSQRSLSPSRSPTPCRG